MRTHAQGTFAIHRRSCFYPRILCRCKVRCGTSESGCHLHCRAELWGSGARASELRRGVRIQHRRYCHGVQGSQLNFRTRAKRANTLGIFPPPDGVFRKSVTARFFFGVLRVFQELKLNLGLWENHVRVELLQSDPGKTSSLPKEVALHCSNHLKEVLNREETSAQRPCCEFSQN